MPHTRVDRMIAYLREHAEEIAALPTGVVQFDIGQGGAVSARITRFDKLHQRAEPKRAEPNLTASLATR